MSTTKLTTKNGKNKDAMLGTIYRIRTNLLITVDTTGRLWYIPRDIEHTIQDITIKELLNNIYRTLHENDHNRRMYEFYILNQFKGQI